MILRLSSAAQDRVQMKVIVETQDAASMKKVGRTVKASMSRTVAAAEPKLERATSPIFRIFIFSLARKNLWPTQKAM